MPFYVGLPYPTIDWTIVDGVRDIPIEERSARELSHMTGSRPRGPMARSPRCKILPEGSAAANPAFDVTPARLVTALITERGVCAASEAGLLSLYPEHVPGGVKVTPAAKATAGLGLTQIVGWGTTFLMPSVLGRHIQHDLGLPSEVVYGGITVMFGVGALFSPWVGRLLDRTGPRAVMAVGSVLYALSLAALAFSQGNGHLSPVLGRDGHRSTLALNTPSSIALAQIAGTHARQAIAVLAIIGGFASTVFWPVSEALEPLFGWRGVVLIYAAIHLAICAPVHLLMLPGRPIVGTQAAAETAAPVPPSAHTERIFLLLSISLSCGAFIFTGFIVHAIGVLRGLGHDPATALLLATLIGPAQVAVRVSSWCSATATRSPARRCSPAPCCRSAWAWPCWPAATSSSP